VRIEEGATVRSSVLASNVTLERGALVEGCTLRDCIVGERTVLRGCTLRDSVIGNDCRIEGVVGQVNAGPFTEVVAQRPADA
jgi:ADP-glucose pyrophosphorylase